MNYLPLLLAEMLKNNLDAYILKHTNEHLSEFISESDMRVKALTGFTGSNATAVITNNESVVYTDSRYFLQANKELKEPFKLRRIGEDEDMVNFLKKNAPNGNVGIDIRFISHKNYKSFVKDFEKEEISIIPLDYELFDKIWESKPKRSTKKILDLELINASKYLTFRQHKELRNIFESLFSDSYEYEYEEFLNKNLISGINSIDKIKIVQKNLKDNEGIILSTLDSIAWILNLRGFEIPENTVFHAYMYINNRRTIIFTDSVIERSVEIQPYKKFYNYLNEIEEEKIYVHRKVNAKIVDILGEEKIHISDSIDFFKSVKNKNEIEGAFQAGILDGLALVKLFTWLSKNNTKLTESSIGDQLVKIKNELTLHSENKKKEKTGSFLKNKKILLENFEIDITFHIDNNDQNSLKEFTNLISPNEKKDDVKFTETGFLFPSFANVIAYGQNAAIVHHAANETEVDKNNILLLDTGSQYLFGTTDITRCIHLGTPSPDHIHDFTLVLKGQLMAKRLVGNSSDIPIMIENLPKYYLWQENKDYYHGTSHGIGSGLNVHEGPPFDGISKKIEPHQIFSIEPGYYKENKYGIRIEDAVLSLFDENIKIENLTFVPLQQNLIDKTLLTNEEKIYLNKYNNTVRNILSLYLTDKDELNWLNSNTEPYEIENR